MSAETGSNSAGIPDVFPTIAMDVRLGEDYEYVDVDIAYYAADLRRAELRDDEICDTRIYLNARSAQHTDYATGKHFTTYGRYFSHNNTMLAYVGSAAINADHEVDTATEAMTEDQSREYKEYVLGRTIAKTLVHEGSHRVDDVVYGTVKVNAMREAHYAAYGDSHETYLAENFERCARDHERIAAAKMKSRATTPVFVRLRQTEEL